MPKAKSRGNPRKSRRLTDFASDIEMVEVDLPRSERVKPKGKNRSGFQTKHEDDKKSRVGKAVPPTQPKTQTARGSNGTGRNPRSHTAAASSINPFAPRGGGNRDRNRQLSTFSALSTQPGPWCEKCNQLNRQLHGYLLDILRTSEQAVDEWAYAIGASPDHMECEPAPERIIPEGYRRCSQQCQSCVAQRVDGEMRFITPPGSSTWSSTTPTTTGYQNQPGILNEAQMGRGPYSQTGPGSMVPRTTPEPTSSPPDVSAHVNHGLVAIPEGQKLLHARWAGPPPAQMTLSSPQAQQPHPLQQPWGGSAHHPINANPDIPAHPWEHPGVDTRRGPSDYRAALPSVFEHYAAVLPLTPPKDPTTINNKPRPRHVTLIPVDQAVCQSVNSGRLQGQVPQW
ncbi:hypothetical protein VP1G_07301 [Cytospora mali]|uniref:Uncharacterized protein n=1 Tax=Cytospora mali TaxID=578113 RepID=A0A194V838_CYTMA|nr:hypothetical protein VP1G_07301 [Valsa mali var. pyri (nom. inval.)]